MRIVIVGAALLVATSAAAQSRWTFSAGPEWTSVTPKDHVWGMRARAEYDLTKPNSVLGLRLEGAALWSPTQSYFYEGSYYTSGGTQQGTDLMLGVNGSLSPIPHARVAPYVTMGIYGRQQRIYGSGFFNSSLTGASSSPPSARYRGDILGTLGLGVRMRLMGRAFQLEYRRIYDSNGLTFGARLPF